MCGGFFGIFRISSPSISSDLCACNTPVLATSLISPRVHRHRGGSWGGGGVGVSVTTVGMATSFTLPPSHKWKPTVAREPHSPHPAASRSPQSQTPPPALTQFPTPSPPPLVAALRLAFAPLSSKDPAQA